MCLDILDSTHHAKVLSKIKSGVKNRELSIELDICSPPLHGNKKIHLELRLCPNTRHWVLGVGHFLGIGIPFCFGLIPWKGNTCNAI